MTTPIKDFIDNYLNQDFSRLHMPGHKGSEEFEKYDLTEIQGADSLYDANGIIAESELNATHIFGTKHTFYSTEGSSQCIKAMLCLAVNRFKEKSNERPIILAARNIHKAFIHSAALIDFDIDWIMPKKNDNLCSCFFSLNELEAKISKLQKKLAGVYITSPDYLGNILEIKEISKVCKKYEIPLLVDNAHGAYLKFLNRHPVQLGADMCCDSAHKTLPVLTGGAYLHINNQAFLDNAKEALAVFGSTSPSYLILRSLDLNNKYLANDFEREIKITIEKIKKLEVYIKKSGVVNTSQEPLKLTLCAENLGYSGFDLSEHLRKHKIECEYSDEHFVVLMFSAKNKDIDYERIKTAFSNLIPKKEIIAEYNEILPVPKQALTIRQAYFSPQETVDLSKTENQICGFTTVSCPPAVPIAVSGELITAEHIKLFKKYGIHKINIVK